MTDQSHVNKLIKELNELHEENHRLKSISEVVKINELGPNLHIVTQEEWDDKNEMIKSLLDFVKYVVAEQIEHDEHGDQTIITRGEALISKAAG